MRPESGTSLSIWAATADVPKFESLKRNIHTDVCIIGGGITGLTIGYLLSQAGTKVSIIDDGNIGGGETARTTAHISNVIDNGFMETERLHGEKNTRLVAQSQIEAINTIEKIIRKENIDCDFKRLDGFWFFQPNDPADLLEKQYDAAVRAGVNVEITVESPLKSFNRYPCLKFAGQAQFHILKYIAGLSKAIRRKNGHIFTHTHAGSIEDGNIVKIKTKSKHTINAKDVVVATNSPVSDYKAIHSKQIAIRTYVVGIKVPKNSIKEALYWDNDEPYHYIRLYKEKENDVLIIGGEDHITGHDKNPEKRLRVLESWAKEHFKNLGEVKYKWSGQVLEPFDGLSFIGKDPDNAKHVYIATGDNGMGITHGTFAGLILRDLILGKKNDWAKLYDPNRVTLKAAPKTLKEGAKRVAQYTTIISPGDLPDIKKIKKGGGVVLREKLEKIAVFKDEKGKVKKFSALCPHLKCVLQWNSFENSWDCPCHGSRFDAGGKVINGPAIGNMKSLF
jgi:glycine/D-amino acid oxidase-like deaminating enzyme/nitrite reductase/ring-hydroxylating ferredoxin subunit